jgi:hypothetical protein
MLRDQVRRRAAGELGLTGGAFSRTRAGERARLISLRRSPPGRYRCQAPGRNAAP